MLEVRMTDGHMAVRPAEWKYIMDKDYYIESNNLTYSPAKCPKKFVDALLDCDPSDVSERRDRGQAILDALCYSSKCSRIMLTVTNKNQGLVKGVYRHNGNTGLGIVIWQKTRFKGQPVSNLEFLKTLVHEYMHHEDVNGRRWAKSFHTAGFYTRVSNLTNKIRGLV